MDTLKFVSRVFTVLGQDIVKHHTADLIIDIPSVVATLQQGEIVRMLVRGTGSDTMERYRACLEEHGKEHISEEDCRDYCDQSLGWWVECTLHLNDSVELRLNKKRTNDRGNIVDWKGEEVYRKYDFEGLKWRFADYGINAFFTDED